MSVLHFTSIGTSIYSVRIVNLIKNDRRRVVALEGIVVKDVACGGVHSCALTAKDTLYAWGGGQAGQLGLGPQHDFFFVCP